MKKKYCIYLLFLANVAVAQNTKRNLLNKFKIEDVKQSLLAKGKWKPFPQTVAAWHAKLSEEDIRKFIEVGNADLNKPFNEIPATIALEYKRTGNRIRYQDLSFAKRNQLWNLVVAESMEGKGRFLDQILNGVWSISEETFWGISAHVGMQDRGLGLPDVNDPVVDLFAAETAEVLAWTDYLVGDQLTKISPLIRDRIKTEVERRVFKPILNNRYAYLGGGNSDAKLNNWAPWVMSNYISATLLLEDDQNKRANNIMMAIKYVNQYLNGLGNDGACEEGPHYWFAAGGSAYDCLNFISEATNGKIDIFKDPFIAKMGDYIYNMHIAGSYFVNIADAPSKISADGLMIYRFGVSTNNTNLKAFGKWVNNNVEKVERTDNFMKFRNLYNALAKKDCEDFSVNYRNTRSVFLPDVEIMTARANGMFVAAHGGNNNESHNHNDVGDFIVYADGQPVVIDAGAGLYTAKTFSSDRYKLWFNTSAYHNLPTINGIQQKSGSKFAASGVKFTQNHNQTALALDIARAYPSEANLESWNRIISMAKNGKITVSDQFKATKPLITLTQSLITTCETELEQAGEIVFKLQHGKSVTMVYDAKFWSPFKEKIKLETKEDQPFITSNKTYWRIVLTNKFNTKAGKLAYSFIMK